MNVLIFEDESLSATRLEKMLGRLAPDFKVLGIIPPVAGARAWFAATQVMPELVFMDIHLEDDSAFRIITENDLKVPIIFTTAYDTHMLEAFKANSIDYLLKPVDREELDAAIKKFRELWKGAASGANLSDMENLLQLLGSQPVVYKKRFMASSGTRLKSVDIADVSYFYFEAKATFLTTFDDQSLILDYSLEKLQELLDPDLFFRVNRSFIVSHACIETIHTYSGSRLRLDLRPKSRMEVMVSGDRMSDFKVWLGK